MQYYVICIFNSRLSSRKLFWCFYPTICTKVVVDNSKSTQIILKRNENLVLFNNSDLGPSSGLVRQVNALRKEVTVYRVIE